MSIVAKAPEVREGSIHVHLEWYEMFVGCIVGLLRYCMCMRDGRPDYFKPQKHHSLWMNIVGTLAEMAVAKHLNIYWAFCVDTFRKFGDVAGREVRSTEYKDGRMVIRMKDDPKKMYLFVVTDPPDFWLIGGLYGRECQEKKWWIPETDPKGPAWYVPQEALRRKAEKEEVKAKEDP